jgi:hypothetical protein
MRHQGDLNVGGPAIAVTSQLDVPKHKAGKMLNGVQDGLNLQLHCWSSGFTFNRFRKRLDKPKTSFALPAARAILPRSSGDRALQECNLSTQPARALQESMPRLVLHKRAGFSLLRPSAITAQCEKLIVPHSSLQPAGQR